MIAFLLDRTGSMDANKAETIKGFNGYLDGLLSVPDDGSIFTLTQFDTQGIDIVHDGVALNRVAKLTEKTYEPRGSTNLYDAMAKTIEAAQGKASDKYKVLFVTLTDGMENASVQFTKERVQALMKEREDKDKWTFAHIGVGFDGFDAGRILMQGLASSSNNVQVHRSKTAVAYASVSCCSNAYRASGQTTNCVDTGLMDTMKTQKLDEAE